MNVLGNIFWLLLGGLVLGIMWALAGLLCCVTIIGIPFGVQCFKIAGLALQYRQQLALIDELFASPVLLARKGAPDTEAAFVTGELTPMRLEALLEQLQKEKIEVLGRLFVL